MESLNQSNAVVPSQNAFFSLRETGVRTICQGLLQGLPQLSLLKDSCHHSDGSGVVGRTTIFKDNSI